MNLEGEPTDDALMQAYAAGDATSFERLYRRHQGSLFTFLLHGTGSRARAEDLFQDVFLRVVRGRARFRASGNFRTWIFTIARNALTDMRRRGGLREAPDGGGAMLDESENDARGQSDPATDPVTSAHAADLRDRIEAALLRIPAVQREVFLLRERAGLDFQSIAEATGTALPTVKSRMRYALENLRRSLSGELAASTECSHE